MTMTIAQCAHCLNVVATNDFASQEQYLRYERTGLCPSCQVLARAQLPDRIVRNPVR